ncbi:hypothetical protein ACFQMH_12470 [Streptomyces viridiviolaceus]|uniref:Secreted protein n=1 Tax=Streptomyces viridiviolaceus TaxID=68282 RepID=A0ABW2E2I7_9ACTN|nr:hypothetical protein [Streptomyces viridiviolaceus]
MPRGRHRHSPPLHRLLPPSAIAGVSVVCALGPWVFSEMMLLRSLAAAAAVTAVAGAFVMRRWDAQAGKRVADLTRARASDEWRHEERVAELESDLEESRELRVKLEQRLRAKRAELAGLRNEHASLLRRYATAETERATALEGRRLLEIEAASPTPALPPARPAQETAAQEAEVTAEGSEAGEETPETPAVFSPEGSRLFLRARAALSRFDRETDAGTDAGTDGDGGGDGGGRAAAAPAAEPAREDEAQGQPEAADGHERAAAATTTAQSGDRSEQPAQQSSGHFTVPPAVAVVPTAPARRPMVQGGFDFFGTKNADGTSSPDALEAVQNEDLADVVGQEALALHKAEAEAAFKPADEESRAVGQVIDLTAHDETEQIDMQGLRSAVS